MKRQLAVSAAVFAWALSSSVWGGELPAPPDELQYPNIVQPTYQFKAWGLGKDQLNDPYTCRYSSNGGLIISDFENRKVKTFDFATQQIETLPLRDQAGRLLTDILPFAADKDQAGNIYVVDRVRERVIKFDPGGRQLVVFGEGHASQALFEGGKLAIDAHRVAVADAGHNRVLIYDHEGVLLRTLGRFGEKPGEFAGPESVAFDRLGNLYVLDTYNNRIQVFDSKYGYRRGWGQWGSFKGFLANPSDIAVTDDDRVFVTDLLNHRIQAFTTTGDFLFQFGRHPPTAHEGSGRVHYPTSVSVSRSTGDITVCEPFESRFQRFSFTGVSQIKNVNDSAWWEKGTKFHYGSKVEAGLASLAVSEPDTHAILYFKLDGNMPQLVEITGGQGNMPGQFIRPAGMAIDEKTKQFFVSDSGNHRIQQFDIQDTPAPQQRSESLTSPAGVGDAGAQGSGLLRPAAFTAAQANTPPSAADFRAGNPGPATLNPGGALRFVSAHALSARTASGGGQTERLALTPENIEPSAIHIGPDGLFYVADPENGRLLVMDRSFKTLRTIGPGSGTTLSNPLDFSFAKDGKSLFVVDHYHYRIVQFSIRGKLLRVIGGPGPDRGKFVLPFGITSGKDGFVYVSDVGGQRIEKFTEQGKFVTQWGKWGTDPGEFYKPKGMAQLKDGTLVVVDFGNHRAQMFDPNGKFIRIFGIENAVVQTNRP